MSPLAELIKKLTGKKGFLAGKADLPQPITAPGATNPAFNPLAVDEEVYVPVPIPVPPQASFAPGPGVQGVPSNQGSLNQGSQGWQGWQGSMGPLGSPGMQGYTGAGPAYLPQAVQVSVSSAPVNGVREVTLTAEGLGKKISIQGFGVLVWDGKEWRLDGRKAGEIVSGPIGELGNRIISF